MISNVNDEISDEQIIEFSKTISSWTYTDKQVLSYFIKLTIADMCDHYNGTQEDYDKFVLGITTILNNVFNVCRL